MDDGVVLRLGPAVLSFLIERYHSWNQSVEDFISGIKVFHEVIDIVCIHVSFLRESTVNSPGYNVH
jgi:hypothetical protein